MIARAFVIVATAFVVAACGNPVESTAPGAQLPGGLFAYCQARDPIGRCTQWSSTSAQVRPYDVPPPGYSGPTYPARSTP